MRKGTLTAAMPGMCTRIWTRMPTLDWRSSSFALTMVEPGQGAVRVLRGFERNSDNRNAKVMYRGVNSDT